MISRITTITPSRVIGTVAVCRVWSHESEEFGAPLRREARGGFHVKAYECESIDDAVGHLQRAGLRFSTTGRDWTARPGGSGIVDDSTGTREEVTAHLDGFSKSAMRGIIARVG